MKNLLFFGLDIHILELRGHGKSSIEFQQRARQALRPPLPADLDYDWDIDSYFLYDLPAAVAGVKRITRRERIFYCGHSMGGMLGYGYAGIHDDFEGIITIGSPAELGRGFLAAAAAGARGARLGGAVDARAGRRSTCSARLAAPGARLLAVARAAAQARASRLQPVPAPHRRVPLRAGGRLAQVRWSALGTRREAPAATERLDAQSTGCRNPERVSAEDIRWLLREGGEREPRKVVEQFARWIRRGEMRLLPHRLRLQARLLEDQDPDGDHLRRPGSARLGGLDPQRLPRREERVPALAPGEGQQPHRADDGARHPADLLRHQEPDRVRADAPRAAPRPFRASSRAQVKDGRKVWWPWSACYHRRRFRERSESRR